MLPISLPLARPPWKGGGKKLESMCRKALFDHKMLDNISSLAIALSGGKDSLTLLFLLKAIIGKGTPDIPLHAIHVKGTFSCGPGVHEPFLRAICKELDVSFTVVEQESHQQKNCYTCSRARRTMLFDAMKRLGCSSIAFGHHREDEIQTLLLNLLHKAEFAGMLPKIPMHQYNITIIRPLIYISENAIKNFACSYGFARAMCQCPIGQQSMRKKVEALITSIEELFPNVRENLAQAAMQYGSKKALQLIDDVTHS